MERDEENGRKREERRGDLSSASEMSELGRPEITNCHL